MALLHDHVDEQFAHDFLKNGIVIISGAGISMAAGCKYDLKS
jgi:NAD-dependent SIR2 family protein deacetylase